MKKQTVQPRKKRGPPPTGKGTPIQVRMQPDELAVLDAWIAQQESDLVIPNLSRPEAIRRLVHAGLHPHAFCLSDEKAAEIGAWAKKNGMSLHEAITGLIEIGLKGQTEMTPKRENIAGLDRMMRQAAFFSMCRSIAVELHAANCLDDQALERIEHRALQAMENIDFKDPAWPLGEQVQLMNIAIETVRGEIQYIKHNRDNGNLSEDSP